MLIFATVSATPRHWVVAAAVPSPIFLPLAGGSVNDQIPEVICGCCAARLTAEVVGGGALDKPGGSGPRGLGSPTAVSTVAGYRAVQLDVAVTIVDWPVVHAWSEGDPDFIGEVTVVNEVGVPLAREVWPAPTDVAADWSLDRLGWHRVGAWMWDPTGRRVAPVAGALSVAGLQRDRANEGSIED